jgi:MFS family permease
VVQGVTEPLRIRPFGRLLTSYTLNELGDSVALVALALLVYGSTGEALPTAGLFLAAKFLPAFVAPALTARLDQIGLQRVLPLLYIAEALVFVVLAETAADPLIPLVLVLAFADGTLALTGRGLTRGAIAEVLTPHDRLREGNALVNIGFALASVGGAALGGVLVAAFDLRTALLIDAASFGFAALVLLRARGLPAAHAVRQPLLRRVREGLRHAAGHPRVRALLGGQALALVLFTLVPAIEVVYAKETLGTSDAGFGLLLSSWGAGIVVGSLLYLVARRAPQIPVVLAATAAVGVAYTGMAMVDTLAAACALSVLGGTGNGIQWVAVMTALQEATPLDLQARTVGLLESIGAAMPGVGFAAGGLLTAVWSPPAAFAVAGLGLLALVLAGSALALLRPRRRPAAPSAADAGARR